ncbi:hypothetical protein SMSP2_02379 [Limihaloglobus sulfuriphilus]|uniref:Pilus assembly protein, PilO n=1 Tax=Limihaloglobus sulfuriphilus TaxID=1851148 RepID=A0A1Q2MH35_9BACT|nr:hypothetical protein [Limihaloglobus sulfuriphilus]AQQ72000.1 hypothetical protein SMSP2_02379 [Limihaloglobus sulfuriphilus]
MSRKNRKILLAILIVWAVYFVAMVPFYLFVLYPLQNKAIIAEDNISGAVEKNVIATSINRSKLSELIEKDIEQSKVLLKKFMHESSDVTDLTFAFNEMAKELGLSGFNVSNRSSIKFEQIHGCRHLSEGRMNLNFKADFAQFARFIQRLESFEPMIFVDNFSISLPRNTRDEKQLNDASILIAFLVNKS